MRQELEVAGKAHQVAEACHEGPLEPVGVGGLLQQRRCPVGTEQPMAAGALPAVFIGQLE